MQRNENKIYQAPGFGRKSLRLFFKRLLLKLYVSREYIFYYL